MPMGIMFHHFVDSRHPYIQGSLSSADFEQVINNIGRERILDPNTWIDRTLAGTLKKNDVCLTFDDALLSQAEVALPVLDKYNIKAFFFVYSAIFEGHVDHFEMIRYFRNISFETPHDFYEAFYVAMKSAPVWGKVAPALTSDAASNYLAAYGFYTREDRIFRYVRDMVLDRDTYYSVCEAMMKARGFDMQSMAMKVWLNDAWLKRLEAEGHVIGLHSTSHPTNLGKWTREQQVQEYSNNQRHLINVLGKTPVSVSYPCGCYDEVTLDIMREMGVKVGFRSDEGDGSGSPLEQSRLDYTLYMKRLAV